MEFDSLEVLLRHREHIATVGQEHIPTLLILGHILVLTLLEVLQFLRIVTFNPTSLIEMNGLPTALGVVLVLQTVLNHLELQLTNGADDLTVIELVDEQLGHTLVHQLVDTLLELLGLHRVIVLDILKQLWRERRQTTEMQLLSLGECVANLEHTTCIWQTNDIAGPGFIDSTLSLSHKLRRRRETQALTLTYMQIRLVALELTAAHLTEGDT